MKNTQKIDLLAYEFSKRSLLKKNPPQQSIVQHQKKKKIKRLFCLPS
jgi:hypothetical protein